MSQVLKHMFSKSELVTLAGEIEIDLNPFKIQSKDKKVENFIFIETKMSP